MRQFRQRWSSLIFVMVTAVALLWPAFLNGQPFIFPDTTNYVRGADAAIYQISHIPTVWTDEFVARYSGINKSISSDVIKHSNENSPVTLSGRSVYYGVLLYISQLLGGFWLSIIIQAVLTALSILFTWERFTSSPRARRSYRGAYLAAALIAFLTPAAYFASFAMPDIFAPLGLLALAHLLFFQRPDDKPRQIFWFLLLSFALLAHSANILLLGALFGLALIGALLRRFPVRAAALPIIALALTLGIGGEILFSVAVRSLTGAAPVRPPFVMARIIADGPGYRYLRDTCPGNGFLVCRYLPDLPLNSDVFLWEKEPGHGVFQASSPADRRTLAKEETAFILAVARARPLDLATSAVRSTVAQMAHMGLSEFNYREGSKRAFSEKLPASEARRQADTAANHGTMPTRLVVQATPILTAASLMLFLAAAILGLPAYRRNGETGQIGGFLILVLAGLILNDVITGTMSTPHDRYQARIIWLLPLLACCTWPSIRAAIGRRRQKSTARPRNADRSFIG